MTWLTLLWGTRPEFLSPRRDPEFTMQAFDAAEVCAGKSASSGFLAEVDHLDRLPVYTADLLLGTLDFAFETRAHEVAHMWAHEGPAALVEAQVMALEGCILERMGLPSLAAFEPSMEHADRLTEWNGDTPDDYEAAYRLSRRFVERKPVSELLLMKLQSWEDLLVNVPLDASFIASDPVLERRVLENTHPGPRVWDPSIQESGGWHAWPADPVWHCTRFAEGATWTGFDGLAVEGDMKGAAARFRLPHADLLLANGQMDEGACLETDRGVVTTTARWTTRAPSLPAEGERILVRLGGDTLSLSGHTAEVPDVLLESIDDEALSALVSWAASGDAEGRRQAWSDDDYDGLPHVVETAMGRNPLYAETNSDQ